MRSLLMRYAAPFVIGVMGMLGGLLLVHAYNDHQALHAMIQIINNAAQKQPPVPPAVQ